MRRIRRWQLAAMLLLVVGATACVNTPVRRSAFVPRPTVPANHGAPIGGGGLKGFAHMNTLDLGSFGGPVASVEDLFTQLPSEGAAGLWIPSLQLGAGVYGAPNDAISFGAQFHYTRLEWARPNLIGVLEFPPEFSDAQMILGGPGFRVNIPTGDFDLLTPALIAEGHLATVPQAVYVRDGQTQVTMDGEVIVPEYRFERIDRKTFLLPTLALHVTMSLSEHFHLLALVGAQGGVKNVGFDPDIENLENDTLSGYLYAFTGGGIEARYGPVFGTAVLSGAFGQPTEIRFGPSLTVSVGLLLR